MTPAEIFRDWRAGMIAGAILLHLTALAGAWAMIPSGVVTRLDRPIEASFAPAPSSDAVNADSAPLAQEVVSPNKQAEAALEDTAEVVPPDNVKAETVPPVTQPAVKPDAVSAENSEPVVQENVPHDSLATETPPSAAVAATVPQQVASLIPDVLTTANAETSVSVPMAPSQIEPSQEVPIAPAVEKPKPQKPEKSKLAKAPKRKTEPAVEIQPEVKQLAKLDTKTTIKRAQQGGAGAISDIGTADDARASGATRQQLAAILQAAVRSRVRAMGPIECSGHAQSRVSAVVSTQGRIGSVRLANPSGSPALDAAALQAVRTTSIPSRPTKAVPVTIPLSCPQT